MIKKGLKVKIISGKDKNKDGEIIELDRSNNRAKVKGINMKDTLPLLIYLEDNPPLRYSDFGYGLRGIIIIT